MQQFRSTAYRRTGDDTERLVAKAHTEHRLSTLTAGFNHRHRDASFFGGTRPRRDKDAIEISTIGRADGVLRLTFENLLHIENSLNFCHKWIEPWEFAILIGDEEQAQQMMRDLAAFTYDIVECYPA